MAKAESPKTQPLEQHPIALQMCPGTMSDAEFDAFCEDIKRNGQKHDIVLFEDKVLDGMHRYRACVRNGMTVKQRTYDGDDPAGLVVSLNVMRRRMGSTQRAVAGARLNIDFNLTQDDAAKRVGVSKVHVNLVVQAIKSKNARLIKLLEDPGLTREQLHEELVDAGVIRAGANVVAVNAGAAMPAAILSAAGAGAGLDALFSNMVRGGGPAGEDDMFDTGALDTDGGVQDLLGDPPSANGRVIDGRGQSVTEGGMPVVGSRPTHPERRNRDTPAFQLAERFKAMSEPDRISFVQIAWPHIRPLLRVAGVSTEAPAGSPAAVADAAIAKAATAAPAASELIAKKGGKKASKSLV